MSEMFHPSPFRQSYLGQKAISFLGPKTWNNVAAEIKLRRCVNTFKHHIKKLFFDELKKQNDDIFFYLIFLYLDKKTPTRLFSSPISCFFFNIFVPVPPSVLFTPQETIHNENKVYLDLYYAIPVTVSLIVVLLRPV